MFSFSFFPKLILWRFARSIFQMILDRWKRLALLLLLFFFNCIAAPDLTNLSSGTDSILGPGKVHALCSLVLLSLFFFGHLQQEIASV